jgi:hypothetical protein
MLMSFWSYAAVQHCILPEVDANAACDRNNKNRGANVLITAARSLSNYP